MRRRSIPSIVVSLCLAAFLISCGEDANRGTLPTGPLTPGSRQSDILPGTCTTYSNLVSLVNAVFGAGSPNANSALGKLDNLNKQLKQGNLAGAQDQARNIVTFIQSKAAQGTLPGTHAQIQSLISGVLCFAGLSPDTFLIMPSDAPQVVVNSDGHSGISLQGNTVTEPTLITITSLPGNVLPLLTKLDQYPGFIKITQSSPLTKPAVVGVCPSGVIPPEVLARLRLGHQASTGFEITTAADASFLDCSTSTASIHAPEWLRRLASLVMPKPLYAKTIFAAGVGGLVSEFSPFAPVDPDVSLRGGVGGLVSEFTVPRPDSSGSSSPMPGTPKGPSKVAPSMTLVPRGRVNTVVNGTCTQIDAIVGNPVETECRPVVTLTTFQGTILQSVPVGWAIGQGGGVVAPEATVAHTCGAFGSTASTSTDVNGNSSVCWTLGSTPVTNTVVATPTAGGDVPAGTTFSPAAITFSAIARQITPTATATGGTFVYDGLGHPGSGTCSNSLTPALSYSPSVASPTNVATYTLSVTCGAGDPLYVTVTQTATIQITPAATTTAVTCPTSAVFTGSPLTPCSAAVSGPGLSQSVTPTYTSNVNAGTATANAAYAGGGNYQASSGSATFQITPAATTTIVTCPASVVFNGSAQTPCTATANGPGFPAPLPLTPSYTNNVNAGTASAMATYTGGGNYAGSNGSATFQIAGASTVAAVSCPASVTYTGSPVTPCSGSVTGPGLNLSVTPSYTSNVVGIATATVNYAGGGNYLPSSASKTFQILYAQSGCFSSPIYSVMPSTKSFQNKGSNVPIKCTLLNASGTGVTSAGGDLLVQDMGPNGTATPVTVFSLAVAFKPSSSGNYAYGLDTSPAGFVSSHYYRVTATWTDGSTTTGWFYIK